MKCYLSFKLYYIKLFRNLIWRFTYLVNVFNVCYSLHKWIMNIHGSPPICDHDVYVDSFWNLFLIVERIYILWEPLPYKIRGDKQILSVSNNSKWTKKSVRRQKVLRSYKMVGPHSPFQIKKSEMYFHFILNPLN